MISYLQINDTLNIHKNRLAVISVFLHFHVMNIVLLELKNNYEMTRQTIYECVIVFIKAEIFS